LEINIIAKTFIFLGFFLFFIGIILLIFPNILSWFGNLTGDIYYKSGNIRIFMPLASMLILSIGITFFI
jgi:hypothetical protein